MRSRHSLLAGAALVLGLASVASAQSAHVLYDFATGDEGWAWAYNGSPVMVTGGGGNLTFTTPAGANFIAFAEDSNNTGASFLTGSSTTPFNGVSALEFDLGYTGTDATLDVQFYAQSTSAYTYSILGTSTITAGAGTTTVAVPLTALTEEQKAEVRQFGFQVNVAQTGAANWTLAQVRTQANPAGTRVLANFASNIQGAHVNFMNAAVTGNTGQDGTGLSRVAESGTDGVLSFTSHFVDGSTGGGAIGIGNTFYSPVDSSNGYLGRPIDLTGFERIQMRVSASGTGAGLTINPFVQATAGYVFTTLDGVTNTLPRDGAFHTLEWNLTNSSTPIANLEYVMVLGFMFPESANGDPITYKVDSIVAKKSAAAVDSWEVYY